MDTFLDNSLFRNVYCHIAGVSEGCAGRGYDGGLLPGGWEWVAFMLTGLVIMGVLVNGVLGGVLMLTWAERRLLGRFQGRQGPNRWGPYGLLTPLADAIKTMTKEDVVPAAADRFVFNLAPVIMLVPVLLVFAVIPLGSGTFLADLNVGILFVVAVTSTNALAILMAGWGSANRYGMFGGMRAVAMLLSYEIPMAISIVGVLLLSGSLSLVRVVEVQDVPFALVMPLGFLVFVLASIAEINRTPFDITEAESELVAGYHTDYSGMKFGLFYLAEFAAAIAAAGIIVTLFLSGWRGFSWLPSHMWFFLKLSAVLFGIIWLRATWPRLRIDQILALAWKGLFELTLVNLVAMAILVAIWPEPTTEQLWIMAGVNWGVFFVAVYGVGRLLGPRPHPSRAAAAHRSAATGEGTA